MPSLSHPTLGGGPVMAAGALLPGGQRAMLPRTVMADRRSSVPPPSGALWVGGG